MYVHTSVCACECLKPNFLTLSQKPATCQLQLVQLQLVNFDNCGLNRSSTSQIFHFNREVSQGHQLEIWSHLVLLQIDYLGWENWGPDIPGRKADAKKKDPEKKWSREEGEDSQWREDPWDGGGSWRSGSCVETNARDPQGPGRYQLRQVTNSWGAAQHKLTQLSVPPSQTSSHLPAGQGSWDHMNTIWDHMTEGEWVSEWVRDRESSGVKALILLVFKYTPVPRSTVAVIYSVPPTTHSNFGKDFMLLF